jgi:hypothetical protein
MVRAGTAEKRMVALPVRPVENLSEKKVWNQSRGTFLCFAMAFAAHYREA